MPRGPKGEGHGRFALLPLEPEPGYWSPSAGQTLIREAAGRAAALPVTDPGEIVAQYGHVATGGLAAVARPAAAGDDQEEGCLEAGTAPRRCCLHVNHPDHVFDKGLKAEAERVADELTRSGFPIRVDLRYGRGDESSQLQQIEADRRADPRPSLFIVIPINKDAVYRILSGIVDAHEDVTCVFLHQPLARMQSTQRQAYGSRLFSVAADQAEIGRIQARQFAALVPGGAGDVLYVQGRATSFATAERMKGLLAELPRTSGVKLTGYRVYGDWSPGSVRPAVEGWMQLGGRLDWIQAAGAQNDDMALALSALLREKGHSVPVIGVDGLEAGKRAVDEGVLAATVVQPLGVGQALRTYRDLLGGKPDKDLIPEDGNIVLKPESYPPLAALLTRPPPATR